MTPLLIVIDMQNNFISPALWNCEADFPWSPPSGKNREFSRKRNLPRHPSTDSATAPKEKNSRPHCIKNSEGWRVR